MEILEHLTMHFLHDTMVHGSLNQYPSYKVIKIRVFRESLKIAETSFSTQHLQEAEIMSFMRAAMVSVGEIFVEGFKDGMEEVRYPIKQALGLK